MAPAPKSSPDWRAAYCTLNSTAFADEHRWVDTWAILNPSSTLPVWAGVFRDPMQWPLRRWPWHAPAWDAVAGGTRLCRVSCANTKRFGTNSSCRNAHFVTRLHHAGVWNMEQAVPRYHVCFTVTAAALAGSTYQTSDGASKRTQTWADLN